MIKKYAIAIITLLLVIGLSGISKSTASANQAAKASGVPCDRECLRGFVTQYLDAMVAHKPDSLPVAANVKFTEDCKELKLGEGFWKTFTSLTNYRRDILDVRQGVAVSFLVVNEDKAPVLFVIRLKVVDKKITEIETMAVHNQKEGMLFNTQNLQTASKTMTYMPDKTEKVSREDAIRMAVTYPAGLKIGSFVKVDSPMAPDAYRYENGQLMAGPGCTFFKGCDNMKTQMIPVLSQITQRVVAMDEDLQVVVVRMNFGPGSTFDNNGVLDVWHSFKIYGGLIRAAEAYCKVIPTGTPSGWE
jgi:hypothetical protein